MEITCYVQQEKGEKRHTYNIHILTTTTTTTTTLKDNLEVNKNGYTQHIFEWGRGWWLHKGKIFEHFFLYNSSLGSMLYTLKFKMNKKASPKIEIKIKQANLTI